MLKQILSTLFLFSFFGIALPLYGGEPTEAVVEDEQVQEQVEEVVAEVAEEQPQEPQMQEIVGKDLSYSLTFDANKWELATEDLESPDVHVLIYRESNIRVTIAELPTEMTYKELPEYSVSHASFIEKNYDYHYPNYYLMQLDGEWVFLLQQGKWFDDVYKMLSIHMMYPADGKTLMIYSVDEISYEDSFYQEVHTLLYGLQFHDSE